MQTTVIDPDNIIGARLTCTICSASTTISVKRDAYDQVAGFVVDHCHPGRGSRPSGVNEDIAQLSKFFAIRLKEVVLAAQRRNLELRFEVATYSENHGESS